MKKIFGLISHAVLCINASAADIPKAPTTTGTLLQQNKALIDFGSDATQMRSVSPGKVAPENGLGPKYDAEHNQKAESTRILINQFSIDYHFTEPVEKKIQALFDAYKGRRLLFSDIDQVRHRLDAILRQEVDLLAFVQVPRQDISNGTLHFEFMQAKIQSVRFANHSSVATDVLEKFTLRSNDATADGTHPLTWHDVTDAIKRISDLPGVDAVVPQLSPGTEIGSTQLDLKIAAAKRIRAALLVDNSGSPSSGKNRVGGQIVVNNPLGLGDQLQATALSSPQALQNKDAKDGASVIGQVSYELPFGYQGTRIGGSYTRANYSAGGGLADLSDGLAEIFGLYASRSLMQAGNANLSLRAALYDKNLTDTLFGFHQKRHSQSAEIALSGMYQGSFMDKLNVLQFSSVLTAGSLQIRDPGIYNIEALPHGGYLKSNLNAEFTQALAPGILSSIKLTAQLSNTHLDASEQMPLSGAGGVRAYNSNMASVDQGIVASANLTKALTFIPGLSTNIFYDFGRGQINKNAQSEAGNLFSASGYGVGLSWQYQKQFSMELAYSRRIGSSAGQFAAPPAQIWVNAAILF
ncbi:ShlB/FhaC/HecB family hemolysin secretion/activation protein [Collimonas pratensis]|nr:ShlB/FhaC/HecB family hemolysin secretion/activation protein [Collimonas pratensis]